MTKPKFSSNQKTQELLRGGWRNWGDYPLVVILTLCMGLIGTVAAVINIYQYFAGNTKHLNSAVSPFPPALQIAIVIAILFGFGTAGILFYRRRRPARHKIPLDLEPLAPTAALRGLLPFEEKDHLPGRAREVQDLYTIVAGSTFRFGVLWGDTGCGKTSLLRAGLVPTLRANDFLPLYLSKPTKYPQDAIRTALDKEASSILGKRDEDIETLLRGIGSTTKRIVVLLDQFEEFFVANKSQRSRSDFSRWIGELMADANLPVAFLISIRADYFAHLQSLAPSIPEPTTPRTTYQLQSFNTEQAKAVLDSAAKIDATPFVPALIEAVVDDLETEGTVRPVELQIVSTWLKRKNVVQMNKYEVVGRAKGILSSYIRDEISRSVNRRVASLILRLMVSDDGVSKSPFDLDIDAILQGMEAGTEAKVVRSILNQFISARIVIHTDADRYNLVHDYLAPYIHAATEGMETNVERANRLLKRLLAEYREEPRTRIPFRQLRDIQRYASIDLRQGERARDLIRKSSRQFLVDILPLATPLLLVLIAFPLQLTRFYFSTQPSRNDFEATLPGYDNVVVKSGVPQFPLLSGFSSVAVQTDFQRLDTNGSLFDIQSTGFWFERTDYGYAEWGDKLAKNLRPPAQARAWRWLNQPAKAAEVLVVGLLGPEDEGYSLDYYVGAWGELARINPEVLASRPDLIIRLSSQVTNPKALPISRLTAAGALGYITEVSPRIVAPDVVQSVIDIFTNLEGYPYLYVQTENGLNLLLKSNPQMLKREHVQSLISIIGDPTVKSTRRIGAMRVLSRFAYVNPEIVSDDVAQTLVSRLTDPKSRYTFRKDLASALVELGSAKPGTVVVTAELLKPIATLVEDTDADPALRVDAALSLGALAKAYPQAVTRDTVHAVMDLIANSSPYNQMGMHRTAGRALVVLARTNPRIVGPEVSNSLVALFQSDPVLRYDIVDLSIALADSDSEDGTASALAEIFSSFLGRQKLSNLGEYDIDYLDKLVRAKPALVTLGAAQPLFEVVIDPSTSPTERFYTARALARLVHANTQLISEQWIQALFVIISNPMADSSLRKDAAYLLGEMARAKPSAVKLTPMVIQELFSLLEENRDYSARLSGAYAIYLFNISGAIDKEPIDEKLQVLQKSSEPQLRMSALRLSEMMAVSHLVREARRYPEEIPEIRAKLIILRRHAATQAITDSFEDNVHFAASVAADEVSKINTPPK